MRRRIRWGSSLGMLAYLACSGFSNSDAADAIVQDFGGWKITIQPGKSYVDSQVGPTPEVILAGGPVIQPAQGIQEGVPPAPEGVARLPVAPSDPAADGLPIITPGESSQCCDPKPIVSPPEGTVDPRYLSQMYVDIYKSIPFIRAEYDANPSYIQDTAVEFLFGKMRPTVVHRGTVNVNHNSPYSYGYPYFGHGSSYGYGGYGYGGFPYGYAYPPLQLVVPGTGLRIHRLN